MLELPESHVISRQMREVLQGKTITHVEANHSPHGFAWYHGDPSQYPHMLIGKCVMDVQPNAGQIELFLEDFRLMLHDGVNVRYLEAGEKQPLKHQLYVAFEDTSAFYCTVQMYGGMMAFPAGTYENFYYSVAKEKPTPYTQAFTPLYFESILKDAKPTISVKALLATEQRIPGLGNGCLQDILFYAQIHPQAKLRDLLDEKIEALYGSVKTTLSGMREHGGRNTEKDFYGNPGGYPCVLSSKTLAYPCPRCGGAIARKAFLGGNIYFCAACQPLE